MNGDKSLVDLGDISKPAAILAEKVCGAIGILYEPTRIRRRARAEADASRTAVQTKIELDLLEAKAFERLIHQETKRQENIEAITSEAVAQLAEDARPEGIESDWITHFFRQCEDVSDNDMQSLWSRILSREGSRPGSFAKRTINFVASIDKKDAALFTEFGQFVWNLCGLTPLIFDLTEEPTKVGLSFSDLKHLDAIGLVSLEILSGYKVKSLGRSGVCSYFGTDVSLQFKQDRDNELGLGKVQLTQIGQELFPICGARRNQDYFESVIARWQREGMQVIVRQG